MAGLVGLLFLINWKLALISLGRLPGGPLPHHPVRSQDAQRAGQVLQRYTELNTLLQETISGIRIVKAFAWRTTSGGDSAIITSGCSGRSCASAWWTVFTHPVMETLGAIGVVLAVWVGGYLVIAGELTPGGFVAFLGALGSLYQPIKRLSQVNNNVQQGVAGLTRIYALLDTQPDVARRLRKGPADHPGPDRVRRGSLCLRCGPANPDHVSLSAKLGELVAIVGPSGAGKTTLVNLIPRFYDPSRGAVAIDGVDVREVTLHSLRAQMGIVTQETILFDDTIANNIAYGGATSARPASKRPHGWRMPTSSRRAAGGYQTRIGERGVRLSGGQRQRSPSPGHPEGSSRSSSWTRRPPRWMRNRNGWCRRPWTASWSTARPLSSPIACPRSSGRTRSWS